MYQTQQKKEPAEPSSTSIVAGTLSPVAAASSGHNHKECSVESTDSTTPTPETLLSAFSVAQAEDITARSSFVLRADIRAGKLTAYKFGGLWRILPSDLEAYRASLITPSRSAR